MSTEIGKIKGRYESIGRRDVIKYLPIDMNLTSYWGGDDKMLQLTLDSEYIQLTRKQVRMLINILNKFDQ